MPAFSAFLILAKLRHPSGQASPLLGILTLPQHELIIPDSPQT